MNFYFGLSLPVQYHIFTLQNLAEDLPSKMFLLSILTLMDERKLLLTTIFLVKLKLQRRSETQS